MLTPKPDTMKTESGVSVSKLPMENSKQASKAVKSPKQKDLGNLYK